MQRREFITLLGAAAAPVLWPVAARAQQQRERVRRVGLLVSADGLTSIDAFRQTLAQAGWRDGANIRIDMRAGRGNAAEISRLADDLVAQAPDILVTTGTAGLGALLRTTRTIPIVFALVADPVGAGFVESMAHPGGNATGFLQFEYTLSGKWLELLKQIAPQTRRVAVLRDPDITAGIGQFAVIQSVAPQLGVEISAVGVRDPAEIERSVAAFARAPNGGLIVTASALATVQRSLIIALAERHKLPAVYFNRGFPAAGGLISYSYDAVTQMRGAASYVDRILRGEKPADLPVQAPVKYETVLNLKTAKALGIELPPQVLVRADEVIE
jgi:putative ABC transport system substrate-binding protein